MTFSALVSFILVCVPDDAHLPQLYHCWSKQRSRMRRSTLVKPSKTTEHAIVCTQMVVEYDVFAASITLAGCLSPVACRLLSVSSLSAL